MEFLPAPDIGFDPMSDIKLFQLKNGQAAELQGDASDLEKPLQNLIEGNLEPLLGIRFLASEYSTGKTHAGRIDSLGLDENNCPVILEYKRSTGENVINQGLFYLDWLMDHRGDFERLVTKQLGHETADGIDWSAPRLVCIAADFTKYDGHAVQQINRNIELIRYRLFGADLLLLELVNATNAGAAGATVKNGKPAKPVKGKAATGDKTYAEWLESNSEPLSDLLASVEDYIGSLGDDVQKKELKLYAAFKRLKNFATVVLQKNRLMLYLHLRPSELGSLPATARDVSKSGHWGTGDLELSIASASDFELAKPYIRMAYEGR
jgi:predicted transport protein